MKLVKANGFDNLHMAFYKNHDIGNDGVWDVWQIEGPAMLWYFRGEPHVHTWVHIREQACWSCIVRNRDLNLTVGSESFYEESVCSRPCN
jgi:hypothetical protein